MIFIIIGVEIIVLIWTILDLECLEFIDYLKKFIMINIFIIVMAIAVFLILYGLNKIIGVL